MKSTALLLLFAAVVAFAEQHTATHYLITEATVANLLSAAGANVASSQVHLPMQLTASNPEPHLEIIAVRKLTEHELNLEVRCQTTSECLPFDALIDVNDTDAISAAHSPLSPHIFARRSRVDETTEKSPFTAGHPVSTLDRLRSGTQVVLVILDGRMRIQLPAVTMDDGARGALIRVCTLDRKKTFHAVVLDGSTVKGVIE